MLISFLRSLILYLIVIFGLRIMGKRQLGQLQPSELVITILISNIATLPIENSDVPLILGIVPILTLMCFVVIQDGKLDQQELADLRYSVDDLMEQLRINGIFDLREVDYAVAETTGQLSVRKKAQYETLNAQTLQIQLTPQPVPVLVINDRKILDQGLKACGLTEGAFKKILKKEGYRSEDIFLMTCTPQLDYYIVPMNKR